MRPMWHKAFNWSMRQNTELGPAQASTDDAQARPPRTTRYACDGTAHPSMSIFMNILLGRPRAAGLLKLDSCTRRIIAPGQHLAL